MKSIHTLLTALSVAAIGTLGISLTSCDEKDTNERFTGPVSVNAKKNVLLEDFTGQNCSNCPLAATQLATIQAQWGADRVIAVSIHGGSNSLPETSNRYGLGNEWGADYVSHWGVTAFPKGRIDRQGDFLDYEAWTNAIINRAGIEPKVNIEVDENATAFDSTTNTLNLKVDVTSTGDAIGDGRLQVWLTESNVVQYQLNGSERDLNYQHNHVFRATVSDAYGDSLPLAAGATDSKTYTYTFRDLSANKNKTPWVAANMSIIVFYFNDADGVMQVIEHPLTGE